MAVFGYGRVSTADQTADNQRLQIERAGYAVEYWFADTVSGKSHAAQRKEFGKMLGKFRAKDTLIVSKLDRLGRDAPDVLPRSSRWLRSMSRWSCSSSASSTSRRRRAS